MCNDFLGWVMGFRDSICPLSKARLKIVETPTYMTNYLFCLCVLWRVMLSYDVYISYYRTTIFEKWDFFVAVEIKLIVTHYSIYLKTFMQIYSKQSHDWSFIVYTKPGYIRVVLYIGGKTGYNFCLYCGRVQFYYIYVFKWLVSFLVVFWFCWCCSTDHCHLIIFIFLRFRTAPSHLLVKKVLVAGRW